MTGRCLLIEPLLTNTDEASEFQEYFQATIATAQKAGIACARDLLQVLRVVGTATKAPLDVLAEELATRVEPAVIFQTCVNAEQGRTQPSRRLETHTTLQFMALAMWFIWQVVLRGMILRGCSCAASCGSTSTSTATLNCAA
jgi:hypothetical protein